MFIYYRYIYIKYKCGKMVAFLGHENETNLVDESDLE